MTAATYPIQVARAKSHLRADDDADADIQVLLDAAQSAVLNYLKIADL